MSATDDAKMTTIRLELAVNMKDKERIKKYYQQALKLDWDQVSRDTKRIYDSLVADAGKALTQTQ
ncbi:MAG: hypothetical protein CMF34_01975 [Leeuwenhoekiella sp.]|nr:hypothetical protein [Leeuwenhoekiella sp.]MBH13594.1 hypothetical protein [Leeuwenhoekiella sp.]HAX16376.1 hypothetical protein [Leeuwenhoekiella sp.]|tara:strand:+ start:6250 stop:6444 length:195 start_codon:yes stop_codon:yes gene_type:complete